jgi:SagB-type dehydrogenase family enzyme
MSIADTAVFDERLELRPGAYLATGADEVQLCRQVLWRHSQSLGPPHPAKRAVLMRLAEAGATTAELLQVGTAAGGRVDDVRTFLHTLDIGGWLMRTVWSDDRALYTMQPLHPRSDEPGDPPTDDLVLSRFAVLRREDDRILVESSTARAQMLVHDPEVTALIGALTPCMSAQLRDGDGSTGPSTTGVRDRVVRDMFEAGLVVPAAAESGSNLLLWQPHELWFHARSRRGNGGYFGVGFGRSGRADELCEPLPARREPFSGTTVDLYRPDLAELRTADRTLTEVLEERRSIRTHDDESPITDEQIGELLYRVGRTRGAVSHDGVEYLSRPYPSGGAVYELELYPVVRRATGIAPGIYHYDSHGHRLGLVREPGRELVQLIRAAAYSASMQAPPQVLIVVAARFGRLMHRYDEIPYSLILKHVGVLYQTMYLVATSMGLAACGLGAGDAMAFSDATGLDFAVESSVGEFLVGSRPAK